MLEFRDGAEVYNEMKEQLQTELPEIADGVIVNGILRVVAGAISILWNALKWFYWNLWPQYADREALRRFYEMWGLEWHNSIDTETARRTVLAMFRQKAVGTTGWYRQVVLEHFGMWVSRVDVHFRDRGAGTVTLIVSNRGRPVPDSIVLQIEELFTQDAYNIAGVDIKVRTVKYGEMAVQF